MHVVWSSVHGEQGGRVEGRTLPGCLFSLLSSLGAALSCSARKEETRGAKRRGVRALTGGTARAEALRRQDFSWEEK